MHIPNPIRIAVVDDHAIFRKGLISLLRDVDGTEVVLEAGNGEALLHALSNALTQLPDLCFLDIRMPEMNGYETLVALRKLYRSVRVLAMTAMDDEFNILRMLKAGACGYLLKSTDPEELIAAISAVIERGFYSNELTVTCLLQATRGDKNFALSKREQEFLMHCASECTYREIGHTMNVSMRTVESYRDTLFQKLQLRSREGLVMFSIQAGIATYK